ncbi:hypothetical protein OS122_28980 [Mycolicibacterium mucogenicum]|uniref:hypothetical protein n=1 Tax=Mycolicibacterium mucogenicum TaxID=56689 RepID=UPI002269989A|nr:hypothetical protein [Mycolicibacterium mucogenicum]
MSATSPVNAPASISMVSAYRHRPGPAGSTCSVWFHDRIRPPYSWVRMVCVASSTDSTSMVCR